MNKINNESSNLYQFLESVKSTNADQPIEQWQKQISEIDQKIQQTEYKIKESFQYLDSHYKKEVFRELEVKKLASDITSLKYAKKNPALSFFKSAAKVGLGVVGGVLAFPLVVLVTFIERGRGRFSFYPAVFSFISNEAKKIPYSFKSQKETSALLETKQKTLSEKKVKVMNYQTAVNTYVKDSQLMSVLNKARQAVMIDAFDHLDPAIRTERFIAVNNMKKEGKAICKKYEISEANGLAAQKRISRILNKVTLAEKPLET